MPSPPAPDDRCRPPDLALEPAALVALAGRLEALAGDARSLLGGAEAIGPAPSPAVRAGETAAASSATSEAMARLARLCADCASAAALHHRGTALDADLAWLRREIGALAGAVRSGVAALADEDAQLADALRKSRPAA